LLNYSFCLLPNNSLIERLNELGKKDWEAIGYTLATGACEKGHHFVLLKTEKATKIRYFNYSLILLGFYLLTRLAIQSAKPKQRFFEK